MLALLLALPLQTVDIVTVVETEGTDTVAAETYIHRAGQVSGRIIVKRPARREATYEIDLGEDGLPRSLKAEWRLHEGEPTVEQSFRVTIAGGMLTMTGADGSVMGEFPAFPGAVPTVGRRPMAYGLLQVLADAAEKAPEGRLQVSLLVAGREQPVATVVSRTGDVVTVDGGDLRIEATLDRRLLDTVRSTLTSPSRRTFTAGRLPGFDLDAFLSRTPP